MAGINITSPCIRTCVLDPGSGLCLGCGRSLDEIAQWSGMDEAERVRILAELAERLKNLKPD